MAIHRNLMMLGLVGFIFLTTTTAQAEDVVKESSLAEQTHAVIDLKFTEFYNMPVGPKGLELTPKLLDSVGKKIRITGYMVKAEPPTPGMFVLSPVPVSMGDEDEKLVDDFPPNSIFVHLNDAQFAVPNIDGPISLTGILQVGNFQEVDGHVSTFRLALDAEIVNELKQALSGISTAKK